VAYAGDRITIDLDKALSLSGAGSSANLIDSGRELDLIIVHSDPNRYAVLSGLCTHFPRPLTYIASRRVLQCNNFNHSIFSLEGDVVKGPARLPLRAYAVTVSGRSLHIEVSS
jgi:Rieske Fe-S protein